MISSGTSKTEVLPQKSSVLQIKQDDKFFCRLLSKETPMSNPSFRYSTIAVPFVWESQPGTPKLYTFSQNTLPPLTPPPSYQSTKKPLKKNSRSNLFLALFPKLSPNKKTTTTNLSPPSSFSSSCSSMSSSSDHNSSSSKMGRFGKKRRFLSFGSSFDFRGDYHEEEQDCDADVDGSPTSTLCFGIPRSTSNKVNAGFQGSCRSFFPFLQNLKHSQRTHRPELKESSPAPIPFRCFSPECALNLVLKFLRLTLLSLGIENWTAVRVFWKTLLFVENIFENWTAVRVVLETGNIGVV